MAKDTATADLFEADGVTPKAADKKEPVITEAQLEAERRAARAEGKADALEKVVTAKPAEKPAADKVFTRAELRAAVNEGKITEDQMDDVLERQNEARLLKLVDEKVNTKVGAAEVKTSVGAKINAYVEAFPAINQDGSALRAKIASEYQELLEAGQPDTLATELAAIKIACGPLKPASGKRPGPDGHQEIGSGADGVEKGGDEPGWAKGLGPAQKKHYQKMIDRGIYKGHTDPKLIAEIKLVRRAH